MTPFLQRAAPMVLAAMLAAGAAQATPVTIGFDAPLVMAQPLVLGTPVTVDGGYSVTLTGQGAAAGAIDTGLSAPDPANGVPGDYASQNCFAGVCSTDFTNALYIFRSGGFTLTSAGSAPFDLTMFDAAIASSGTGRAARFSVTGLRAGLDVVTQSFLLLPDGTALATNPPDATTGAAESFQTLTLSGFTNLDAVQFTNVGELQSDPADLMSLGFYPDFAVDALNVGLTTPTPPPPPSTLPEPASVLLLSALIAGLGAAAGLFRRGV